MPRTNSTRRSIAHEIARHLEGGFAARYWSAQDGQIQRLYITRGAVAWGYVTVDADGDLIADGVKAGKDRDRVVAALEASQAAIGCAVAARLEERGGSDPYVLEYATIATVGIYGFVEAP